MRNTDAWGPTRKADLWDVWTWSCFRSTGQKHRSEQKPCTPVNPDLPTPTHMFTHVHSPCHTHNHTRVSVPPPRRHTILNSPPRCTRTPLYTCAETCTLAAHTQHTLMHVPVHSLCPRPSVPLTGAPQAAEKDSWRLLSHAFIHSARV